ncbi:hypothetical protein CR513_23201, partial [Mucuna pruriens]
MPTSTLDAEVVPFIWIHRAVRLTPLQQFRACGRLGNKKHSLFISDASTHRCIDAFIHTTTSVVHIYNLAPLIGVSMCMTRSSSNNLHKFDPEIDRTLYRLRKARSANIGGEDLHKHLKEFDVGDMKRIFLENFFLASRIATIRKEICGLMMMDQNMIDATSGRALMDKTPAIARHLISNIASNTKQFRTREVVTSRVVNEVDMIDSLRLEN